MRYADESVIELPVGFWARDCVKNTLARFFGLGRKVLGIRAVRRATHADGRDHGHAQLAEQGIVARAVDQHRIARLGQVSHEQVERMIGPSVSRICDGDTLIERSPSMTAMRSRNGG